MDGSTSASAWRRWQFGTRQAIASVTLMALALGTIRLPFAGDGVFYLSELAAEMMFAGGCGFAALGVFFGRVATALGFVVGAGAGALIFWRLVVGL